MDSIVTLKNGVVYEGEILARGRHETRMRLIVTGSLTIFPTYAIESILHTSRDSFGGRFGTETEGDPAQPRRCTECDAHVYYDAYDDLYYHREPPGESGFCWLLDTGNGNTADMVQCMMAELGHHVTYDLGGFAQLPRWTCTGCGATTLRQRHGGLEGTGLEKECTA